MNLQKKRIERKKRREKENKRQKRIQATIEYNYIIQLEGKNARRAGSANAALHSVGPANK